MRKLTLALLLTAPAFAQVELVEPPPRLLKVELGFSLGMVDFKEKALSTGWYAGVNVDYRAKYPVLIGGALTFNGAGSEDILMVNPSLRLKVRIPLVDNLKLDPLLSVGLGYTETDSKKTVSTGGVGLEMSYFFYSVNVGLRLGYNFVSDSRLNHLYIGGSVGF